MWQFKVFILFPLLAPMRNLDHWARVLLPVIYVAYIVAFMAEVDFGRPVFDGSDSPCP